MNLKIGKLGLAFDFFLIFFHNYIKGMFLWSYMRKIWQAEILIIRYCKYNYTYMGNEQPKLNSANIYESSHPLFQNARYV